MPYRLRFAFDPGSGMCLWAANDAVRERFGYPVALDDLPLSEATREAGGRLIRRFDTSVDWDDPGGPSPWSKAESRAFDAAAWDWLAAARRELGDGYEIINGRRSVVPHR